jgi:hypothetical protein
MKRLRKQRPKVHDLHESGMDVHFCMMTATNFSSLYKWGWSSAHIDPWPSREATAATFLLLGVKHCMGRAENQRIGYVGLQGNLKII